MKTATTEYAYTNVDRLATVVFIEFELSIDVFNNEHKLEPHADRASMIQPENTPSWVVSPTSRFALSFSRALSRALSRSIPTRSGLWSGSRLDLFDGGSLDERVAIHNRNGGNDEAVNLGECQEWPGIVPIHGYDAAHLDKIWGDVEKEKRAMLYQKEEYERARTEEIETRKKLGDQVGFLTLERVRLRSEQEARERLLRTQEEKKEQRLLKQELAKLKLESQQKYRELQAHLEHQGEENDESPPGYDEAVYYPFRRT